MNSLLLYSICGLLVLLMVYKQRKCWHLIWQLNGWRGLLQQPILWLLLSIYLEPKSIMSSVQRCRKYFQFPLAIIVFNRILLYVDDPVTMESVLTAPECLNKTFLQNGFYANKGLLHASDEQWKLRRKQLNPAFSHNILVSFVESFNRVANELIVKFRTDLKGHNIQFTSLEDLITRAVLEVACLTTMGYETWLLQRDSECIAQTYRYLMEITAWRILRPWYQIDFFFRVLDNENYEKSKTAKQLIEAFVAKIVQQKFIEWQHRSTPSECATGTNTAKDAMQLNEQTENHNFTARLTATGNDALRNIAEDNSSVPDRCTNANRFMTKQPEQEQQQQQQQPRIFIDQMFYLAQSGKLTLQDIMNEAQSMVVVSFETVSSSILNALLCLAINRECQTKLRHEIKQVLSLASTKNKAKNTTTTTAKMTGRRTKQNNDPARRLTRNMNETYANTASVDCANAVNNSRCCAGINDVGDDVQVTLEDLLNMPYLDMITNESLRLLTTVPMNLRHVGADFQLNVRQRDKCTCNTNNSNNNNNIKSRCSSCQHCVVAVPKGTLIALDVFNMQRNELYWGKYATKFHPEHFSKKQTSQQQPKKDKNDGKETPASRHSYAFIPFSKGLRTCIGSRYSVYLTKIILLKLISCFEFSTETQLHDLQYYEGVSLKFHNAKEIHFEIHPIG